jgi:catechol 2,3-dioxygenase-like lactoylglutathione lyase family enzyme
MHRLRSSKRSLRYAAIVVAFCTPVRITTLNSPPAAQPTRPHITGIDYVRVYVSDIDKSRKFYSDVLGLTVGCPQYTNDDICFLVRPSAQRLLLKRAPIETANRTLRNWLADIAFATDDLEQMRLYLLANGQLAGAIRKDINGTEYFRVRDPERHSIVFVQRSPSKVAYMPAAKQVGTHLLHAGFVVKDMAAENRFYVEVLGFRLYWYGGFKDDSIDWYELQVPDGTDWIEYMLNISPNADHKELGVQNHFSFGVKDVRAAARQLRFNGLATFDGPEIGRDGKASLDAYDPDGTRVEVMEFAPTQKPCCHPYTARHPEP